MNFTILNVLLILPVMLKNVIFKVEKYPLRFKFEAGTSRGVLNEKTSYLIYAFENNHPEIIGWGEAAPLPKLSIDDFPEFEQTIKVLCDQLSGVDVSKDSTDLITWIHQNVPINLPSVRFAFETALLDLINGGKKMIFDTLFYHEKKSIRINGLVWMGSKEFMLEQIDQKIASGFDCIKMKIGAINFEEECSLLEYIRRRHTANQITIRVDANGAFAPEEALEKLKILSAYDLHSIEQPIRQGNAEMMRNLCEKSPLAIALDEELIGINKKEDKIALLNKIKPSYIILKPTLVGGIFATKEWIEIAESLNIGWWMTSALESNIGLNAIAQLTSTYNSSLPQGLGTGQLYQNNIASPLLVQNGYLNYDLKHNWGK
jgi:o-succinylbenzoate synthase